MLLWWLNFILIFTSQHRWHALLRKDDQEDPLPDELQEQHHAGGELSTPQRSHGRFWVEDALRLSTVVLLSGKVSLIKHRRLGLQLETLIVIPDGEVFCLCYQIYILIPKPLLIEYLICTSKLGYWFRSSWYSIIYYLDYS